MLKKCVVLSWCRDKELGFLRPGQSIFLKPDEIKRLSGVVREIYETASAGQPEVRSWR